ncbi:MAG: retention module-containing protein, partial [Pseudomonas sp.]|uniref:retention module-containing protein n=1 Tax=Pseudomonas sp. TaxID=306 RepID=UPI003393A38D
MNQVVGIVKSIIGQVFAVSAEGIRRLLIEGDRIFLGEQVVTGADSMISVELADGRTLDLGRDSQWSASEDSQGVTPPTADTLQSVAQTQAAIAAGADPTATLAPTAAGPGAGGGGAGNGGGSNSFVLLDATAGNVDPTIGYETEGLAFASESSDERDGADPAVQAANTAPTAADQSLVTDEDLAIAGRVLASDADGDSLSYALVGAPSNGTLQLDTSTGGFIYTPNADFNGDDSFTLSISDGQGGVTQSQVTVTVNPANDVPLAVNDNVQLLEDQVFSGTLAGNDRPSVDGGNRWALNTPAANGTVVVNPDGTFSYSPNPNFNGTDSFTYTLTDASGDVSIATVTLNVGAQDDTPVAVDDAVQATQAQIVSGNLAGNDNPSADGGNLWTLNTSAANGTVVVNPNGTFSYTPNPNFSGSDSFTYNLTDADGDVSTATVTIVVNPGLPPVVTNTPPSAVADSASTDENTPVTVNVLNNDSDPDGDTLTVTGASAATGTVVVNPNGTLSYTPSTGFTGNDTITYSVSDGKGGTASSTVTVTVNPGTPPNDLPVAVADTLQATEDQVLNGSLATNDTPSADGGNIWALGTQASNGTVIVNSDGTFTYTPNANYNGADSFTYSLTDANGDISTATVTVNVAPVNDLPVAVADSVQATEDQVLNGNLAGNDTPSADGGNVWALGTQASNGIVVVNADGTFTYTPNANYNGADSFTYSLTDANGDVSTATVTVNVAAVNDLPVAVADTVQATEDQVLNGTLAGNDTPSADGGNIWALGTQASNGTVIVN